ncbi:uncharacterized protein LOC130612442 isoform X2 [Hydractinia symbiolongicarpus]|uniref:uncharacterized protein LOC130612442 isoform X2 n=1 Tax=Hydractinia symbiolongicarpus TaxID=13093 RepID=UPI00254DF676|nr:uncharacterized protein LOC130612442 isoform X2 [Hydractinia symbiolongicarpus]
MLSFKSILKKSQVLKGQLPVINKLCTFQQKQASSADHLAKYGQGGRNSFNGIVATVFGATGYLGRYVVNRLARSGAQVIVAYRGVEDDFRHLRVMGEIGQINFLHFDLKDYESILKAMSHSNTVINLISRNYSTRMPWPSSGEIPMLVKNISTISSNISNGDFCLVLIYHAFFHSFVAHTFGLEYTWNILEHPWVLFNGFSTQHLGLELIWNIFEATGILLNYLIAHLLSHEMIKNSRVNVGVIFNNSTTHVLHLESNWNNHDHTRFLFNDPATHFLGLESIWNILEHMAHGNPLERLRYRFLGS